MLYQDDVPMASTATAETLWRPFGTGTWVGSFLCETWASWAVSFRVLSFSWPNVAKPLFPFQRSRRQSFLQVRSFLKENERGGTGNTNIFIFLHVAHCAQSQDTTTKQLMLESPKTPKWSQTILIKPRSLALSFSPVRCRGGSLQEKLLCNHIFNTSHMMASCSSTDRHFKCCHKLYLSDMISGCVYFDFELVEGQRYLRKICSKSRAWTSLEKALHVKISWNALDEALSM